MGLWTSATLNRYINFGGPTEDDDINIYQYSEMIYDDFIKDPKMREIAEAHGVYLTTEIVNDDEQVLLMIHNKNSEVRNHFYAGGLWKVPEVKDDETFFQRSEEFIKELIKVSEHKIEYSEFSDVGKRLTAVS